MPAPPPNGVSSTWPHFSGVDAREVDGLERVAERQRVLDVPLRPEPLEPLREQREDVRLHRRNPRSMSIRRASRSIERIAVAHQRTSSSEPSARSTSSTSTTAARSCARRSRPRRRRRRPRSPRGRDAQNSSSSSIASCAGRSARAAQRLGVLARSEPSSRRIGCSAVPARRTIRGRPDDRHAVGAEQLRAPGVDHVEGAVEPVRPADAADRHQLTRRCRRGRAGCP